MVGFDKEKTITYKVSQEEEELVRKGYILTEDPTYITNYNNARTLIAKIERDELLRHLLKSYLNI